MTQDNPSTVTARGRAILNFEQTQCPDLPRPCRLKATTQLLAKGDYDGCIEEANQAITDLYQSELIKFIDIRMRAHVADKKYEKAFEDATELQKYLPLHYYGYVREGQIWLIQENSIKALEAFANGIKKSTQRDQIDILEQLMEDCLVHLDQKASAYGRNGEFAKAHIMTNCMVKLAPTLPTGYLRSGTLYLMQGELDRANDVYDKAMLMVSHRYLYSLINRKSHIMRQLKPNDPHFFRALENGSIISRIFRFLDAHELAACISVNKRWSTLLLQHREIWQELTIKKDFDLYAIRNALPFVKKLYIQDTCSCIISACIKLVDNGSFASLETFVIDSTYPLNESSCIKTYYLDKSIGLRIDSINKTMVIPLLGQGPQGLYLKKLKPCHGPCSKTHEHHLPMCSHIQSIITARTPHQTRDAIKHCTNLSELVEKSSWISIFRQKRGRGNVRKSPDNLKHLHVKRIDVPEEIYRFINKYINNLETLILADNKDTPLNKNRLPTRLDWRGIHDIKSKTLKKLTISSEDDEDNPRKWISNCPLLEEVTLQDMEIIEDDMFNALRRLPVLRHLEFRSCECTAILRFESFFDLLENKQSTAKLDTLILHDFRELDDSSLGAVSRYSKLRKLSISMCQAVTGEGIESLSEKIGANEKSQLEELIISGIKEVSDQTIIHVIAKLPNLKQLTLDSLTDITDNAINTLVEYSKEAQLQTLKVSQCSQVTQAALLNAAQYLSTV